MKKIDQWRFLGIKTYKNLAVFTYVLILSTLFIGNPLREILPSQDLHAVLFLAGMLLVGLSCLFNYNTLPSWRSRAVYFGLAALFLMFFLRLSLQERSHLIEYCILTLFVFNALEIKTIPKIKRYFFTFFLCFALGAFDEILQHFLPDRVMDAEDVFFNTLAISFVLLNHFLVEQIKKWGKKKPS